MGRYGKGKIRPRFTFFVRVVSCLLKFLIKKCDNLTLWFGRSGRTRAARPAVSSDCRRSGVPTRASTLLPPSSFIVMVVWRRAVAGWPPPPTNERAATASEWSRANEMPFTGETLPHLSVILAALTYTLPRWVVTYTPTNSLNAPEAICTSRWTRTESLNNKKKKTRCMRDMPWNKRVGDTHNVFKSLLSSPS